MLSKNSGNDKGRNGLEAKLEKFIERIDGYIHHNEKEKDRIWHSISELRQKSEKQDSQFQRHNEQINQTFGEIQRLRQQTDQTIAEVKHLRQEFRRWIREQ